MNHAWPSPEQSLRLHGRLCAGDAVAASDFAIAYLNPLLAWLRARHRRDDDHFLQEAAGTTLFDLARRPGAYDPARGDLSAYLRLSAERDLSNLQRSERRHRRGRCDWKLVEDSADVGKNTRRADDPAEAAAGAEEARRRAAILAGVREALPETDRRAFDLLCEGERRTAVFAEALGLSGRPREEQERGVKRVKDRLKKRAERAGVNP
jgi:hypothetical protein